MRAAVVGHVEWISFLKINQPLVTGGIATAAQWWDEPAGGGGVAAVELARLAGHCTLVTAIGDDPIGTSLPAAMAAYGVTVRAALRPQPHRRGVTVIDPSGERTIVVIGGAQSACGADGIDVVDGRGEVPDMVYFCKGDAAMLRSARRARVLVATARVLPVLREACVRLDALVGSAADRAERYRPGDLEVEPLLVAMTEGREGGAFWTADGQRGRWTAAPQASIEDTYGAGDSFAAALTFALAQGRPIADALSFAAVRGAAALGRRGAHGQNLTP